MLGVNKGAVRAQKKLFPVFVKNEKLPYPTKLFGYLQDSFYKTDTANTLKEAKNTHLYTLFRSTHLISALNAFQFHEIQRKTEKMPLLPAKKVERLFKTQV